MVCDLLTVTVFVPDVGLINLLFCFSPQKREVYGMGKNLGKAAQPRVPEHRTLSGCLDSNSCSSTLQEGVTLFL